VGPPFPQGGCPLNLTHPSLTIHYFGRGNRRAQRQEANCLRRVGPTSAGHFGLRAESIRPTRATLQAARHITRRGHRSTALALAPLAAALLALVGSAIDHLLVSHPRRAIPYGKDRLNALRPRTRAGAPCRSGRDVTIRVRRIGPGHSRVASMSGTRLISWYPSAALVSAAVSTSAAAGLACPVSKGAKKLEFRCSASPPS
jgi:hypothetical protein